MIKAAQSVPGEGSNPSMRPSEKPSATFLITAILHEDRAQRRYLAARDRADARQQMATLGTAKFDFVLETPTYDEFILRL
jgi:hypothetical protein